VSRPELPPKRVSESAINDFPHPIFPHHLNYLSTLFGGVPLAKADEIAGEVAQRHTDQICVTKYVTAEFFAPGYQGEILIFKAAVNRTWRTSLEIGVKVLAIDRSKKTTRHIVSLYFILVAETKDGNGKIHLSRIPQVISETDEEKRRYEEAEVRRQMLRKSSL